MNNIRKIVIGKEYTKEAMSYSVGQPVYRKQYTISSIVKDDNNRINIYIEKDGINYPWKEISEHIPYVLEYSLDFS